jgi:hypothetical protein
MGQSTAYYAEKITQAYVAGASSVGVSINPQLWSVTCLDKLLIDACAYCAMLVDSIFSLHKADVDEKIASLKPHSVRWYAEKAMAFQLGMPLFSETDYYDNAGLDESVVLASKIVAYAAVVEQSRGLRLKVAKSVAGQLEPLTPLELIALTDYVKKIKDAGVKIIVTSTVADRLAANITLLYNPLLIDNAGSYIDGSDMAPAKTAIKSMLLNLPFNGIFSIQKMIDALQGTAGIIDVRINSVSANYGNLPLSNIDIRYSPDSGYLRIADADLFINYIPE